MNPSISNKLVDFKLDYVSTSRIQGLEREKILNPIDQCVSKFKKEVELRIGKKVIIVSDYHSSASGLIVKMYAFSDD